MIRDVAVAPRYQSRRVGNGLALWFVAGQKEEGLVELALLPTNGESPFPDPLDRPAGAEFGRDLRTRRRRSSGGDELEVRAEELFFMGSELGFGLQVAQPLGRLARENQREASQVDLLPSDAVDEDVNHPAVDPPDFFGQFCC